MFFVTPAYAEEAPAGTAETGADTHAAPAAGDVHTETGVPAEHHGGGVFPPFDSSTYASQLLWLAITFVVFFVLMQKVIAPRIGRQLGGGGVPATRSSPGSTFSNVHTDTNPSPCLKLIDPPAVIRTVASPVASLNSVATR